LYEVAVPYRALIDRFRTIDGVDKRETQNSLVPTLALRFNIQNMTTATGSSTDPGNLRHRRQESAASVDGASEEARKEVSALNADPKVKKTYGRTPSGQGTPPSRIVYRKKQ
jgi:hypothetical protein